MTTDFFNEHDTKTAASILAGLGGKENITSLDNCITRLRVELKDEAQMDEEKIKEAGAAGILRSGGKAVQVIIGTKVQSVADEMRKML